MLGSATATALVSSTVIVQPSEATSRIASGSVCRAGEEGGEGGTGHSQEGRTAIPAMIGVCFILGVFWLR
ncbi:protein of unknown function [Stenotrophomonas maltophilia]|nr:protein of unknown function [Stenotrophomonas maltophilia]